MTGTQILNRIKNEGVSVTQAAKDHSENFAGKTNLCLNWLAK